MIIAANFKTNLTRRKTAEYMAALETFIAEDEITQRVMVFPPATALDRFDGKSVVGAQNAYPTVNGAYTGELGLEQLEEFGIKTILIGHSERRHVLGESQEEIARKFAFYKEKGFTIVYCIGEPLETREAGNEELMEYLEAQFRGIDLTYGKLVIAYEPVWAIGTGLTPSLNDIELIHSALKQRVAKPLLYGGSVKVNNAKEILELDNVDGVLVGSGALQVADFRAMIRYAQQINKGE